MFPSDLNVLQFLRAMNPTNYIDLFSDSLHCWHTKDLFFITGYSYLYVVLFHCCAFAQVHWEMVFKKGSFLLWLLTVSLFIWMLLGCTYNACRNIIQLSGCGRKWCPVFRCIDQTRSMTCWGMPLLIFLSWVYCKSIPDTGRLSGWNFLLSSRARTCFHTGLLLVE